MSEQDQSHLHITHGKLIKEQQASHFNPGKIIVSLIILTIVLFGLSSRSAVTSTSSDRLHNRYDNPQKTSENNKEQSMLKKKVILMDTLVEITVYGKEDVLESVVQKAISEMKRLETIFNRHGTKGFAASIEKNRYTRHEPFTTTAPVEYIDVIEVAKKLSRTTNGAFNPTIAPVIDLWNFADLKNAIVPSQTDLDQKLKLSSWNLISVNQEAGSLTFKKREATVDCGGIGKGYIVDRALNILKIPQVTGALVNGGGDLHTFGEKPGGRKFRIGIQNPSKPDELSGILAIKDCAVATSGDYERGFTREGRYYHHLLVPQTGYPGRLSSSCTVISTSTVTADAYATAIFILGPEKGIELADSIKSIEAMIITSDGTMTASKGFSSYLESSQNE